MTGDKHPKKKIRRLIGIVGSFVSLVILTYIAVSLIYGRDLGLSRLSNLFSSREHVEIVDEFLFDVGRSRVFADLGDSFAAVGTLGVQVLDLGGGVTLREPFRVATPAVNAKNGRAIAFDIGATAIRVFNESQIIASFETETPIISASINHNGWFCVCTKGTGGVKGIATVYSSKGSPEYKVSLSSGYVLSAALSPDNKSLAVLNLTDNGSRVTLYHGLSSDSPDNTFDYPGGIIVDIWYTSDNKLAAISTQSLISVNKNGEGSEIYSFSGRRLAAYAVDDDFYALHLLDYGVGYGGQLVTLSTEGKLLGELTTEQELVSMSSGGGYLAVLHNAGPGFFNAKLEEFPSSGERVSTAGVNRILAFGNGEALLAGDYSAVVCRTVTDS